MNAGQLPMTATLADFATQHGIEASADLTPLARSELAFNDMLASAGKFDGSFEAAKARFDAANQSDRRKAVRS